MAELLQLLEEKAILPNLVIRKAEDAIPVGQALIDADVPIVEVVLRTEAALQSVSLLTESFPQMIVGCGTILTIEQAEQALSHGASFIVTPGYDEEIVRYCQKKNIPVFPGCVTATEIQKAYHAGLRVLKFFPAFEMGGDKIMAMYQGPFPDIRFILTGGITQANMGILLKCKNVLAVGGAWMFSNHQALEKQDYQAIRENIRNSLKIKEEYR